MITLTSSVFRAMRLVSCWHHPQSDTLTAESKFIDHHPMSSLPVLAAEFSKPAEHTATKVLMDLQSPSLTLNGLSPIGISCSSPCTSNSDFGSNASNDYFSARSRSTKSRPASTGSRGWASHSRQPFPEHQRKQTEQMHKLLQDGYQMSRGSASRWRKVATTMPKSLWKPDAEATTCDHLSFCGGPCEKPFGHFIGKYRLPALASTTFGPISNDHTVQTPSALWGSVKINRRNRCFRCGNCFCDEHSGNYATLILDSEDAPQSEDTDRVGKADDTACAPQADSLRDPAILPVRSAAACLSQYLASAAATTAVANGSTPSSSSQSLQSTSNATSSAHTSSLRNRKQSTVISSALSSAFGSFDSDGSDWSSLSGSCKAAESLRSHGVSRGSLSSSQPSHVLLRHQSLNASSGNPLSGLPKSEISSGSRRQRQLSAASSASSMLPESIVTTRLPDGRYVIRERVCLRCHDIVDQAKARALQRHRLRMQRANEGNVSSMRRSSDLSSQTQQDDDDCLLSLKRLYVDYRCERRKFHANACKASTDLIPHVPSIYKPFLRAPPPQHCTRGNIGKSVLVPPFNQKEEEGSDDEDADASACNYTSSRMSYAHFPTIPSRANFGEHGPNLTQRASTPPHPLPAYGMGGQRLQFAIARYQ